MFCFACKLFGDSESALTAGLNDWKNAAAHLAEHEGSERHRKAMVAYVMGCADARHIDSELKNQFDSECQYCTEVLKSVVVVLTFLPERGLPFRGHSEIFGQPDNGNFIGLLKVISDFDPFLKAYIERYVFTWMNEILHRH